MVTDATAAREALDAEAMLDVLLVDPSLLPAAKAWFKDVQTKDQKYQPVLTVAHRPIMTVNAATMATFRPAMA